MRKITYLGTSINNKELNEMDENKMCSMKAMM